MTVDLEAVTRRIRECFEDDVAAASFQAPTKDAEEKILGWLSNASYREWFALVEHCHGSQLLAHALGLACWDVAEREGAPPAGVKVRTEHLAGAYLRGAAAALEDDGNSPIAELASKIAQEEGIVGAQVETNADDEERLRRTVAVVTRDRDWYIDRLEERLRSFTTALERNEQILASLPRFARTDETKKALAHTQAMLNLGPIGPRPKDEA